MEHYAGLDGIERSNTAVPTSDTRCSAAVAGEDKAANTQVIAPATRTSFCCMPELWLSSLNNF